MAFGAQKGPQDRLEGYQPQPQIQAPSPSGGDSQFLGIPTGANDFSSRVRARLSRMEFRDYLKRFAPIEEDLADFAMGGAGEARAVRQADRAVTDSFEAAKGSGERYLRGFGIGRSPDQWRSSHRQNALESTAARVGARNTARREAEDLQRRIMIGGVGSSGVDRGV